MGVTMTRRVELRVRENGSDILVYRLENAAKAAEMIHFLDGMLPDVSFVVQPVTH